MSTLPINPTPEQLMQAWRDMPSKTNLADIFLRFHQAGVEAERARAAAEAGVEWGTQGPSGRSLCMSGEHDARTDAAWKGRILVRRTVGPWEVQS